MTTLPKNVRIGRSGRIGILKKVPRNLWRHPRYLGKARVIERSTGTTDVKDGVRIALKMLIALEQEFDGARAELESESLNTAVTYLHSFDERNELVRSVGDSPEMWDAHPIPKKAAKRARGRSQVGEKTRQDIISVAMQEFAEKGLRGARVDDIAARTRTTKPMIYYHFGSKEKLYATVMEEAYGEVRSKEQGLRLNDLPPEEAMRRLVEVTFDHHALHPEHVRLVCVENMERARHISGRPSLVERNAIAIETVRSLLERGQKEGAFRPGINPWHLHLLMTSFCFIRVSNRYTWKAVFNMDLWEPESAGLQRELIVDAVLRYVKPTP